MKKKKLLFFGILPFFLLGCSSKEAALEDYRSSLDYVSDFTILQLTDIHWSLQTDLAQQEAYLNHVFLRAKEASPRQTIDLVMITGDCDLISNKEVATRLFDLFLSWDVPYGLSWGNHDFQGNYSPEWLEALASRGRSVYKKVDDSLTGRSNYVVNLIAQNKTVWQIFALDSNSYQSSSIPARYDYDYIHDDQAEWVNKEAENVPSLAYFHIPTEQWPLAEEDYLKNGGKGSTSKMKWERNESFCNSKTLSKFFLSALTHDFKGLFCGHDHSNERAFTYDGVVLSYGLKSGKELYYSHSAERNIDLIGGSLQILHDDGSFTLRHVYVQDDEAYSATHEDY
jgi:hypothetical protein